MTTRFDEEKPPTGNAARIADLREFMADCYSKGDDCTACDAARAEIISLLPATVAIGNQAQSSGALAR